MENKYMQFINYKDGYLIEKGECFDPFQIFDCGQCFRFKKIGNTIIGVAFGTVIKVVAQSEDYYIYSEKRLEKCFLLDFLDIKRDYKKIQIHLAQDEIISPALLFGEGIRILKQEFFETLVSFIISQQNNIPRIINTVEKMAQLFGEKIMFEGEIYYTFPTPQKLKDISIIDLEPLKIGYRAKYVIDAINKVNSGEINYEEIKDMSYLEAKNKLLTINGVGAKVADCICLFSLGHFEAFPTDTWIKKAMDKLYNISEDEILEKSKKMFGEYSGIAQQYLFYYLRYLPKSS